MHSIRIALPNEIERAAAEIRPARTSNPPARRRERLIIRGRAPSSPGIVNEARAAPGRPGRAPIRGNCADSPERARASRCGQAAGARGSRNRQGRRIRERPARLPENRRGRAPENQPEPFADARPGGRLPGHRHGRDRSGTVACPWPESTSGISDTAGGSFG